MTIGLGHYLSVGAILFTLGILGIFLNRKNIIVILMSIELILLAVNINLVAFSTFLGDIVGQVFALLVLTVAAAEAAIGLAVLVMSVRLVGGCMDDAGILADRRAAMSVCVVGMLDRVAARVARMRPEYGDQPREYSADQRQKDDCLDHVTR